jgi:nucleotide-binding universal stress UspA family protein
LRHIVAGVDLTVIGRRVADRAGMIAESTGSDLNLVHVLEPVAEALINRDLAGLMKEHQTDQAQKLAEWVRGRTKARVNLEVVKGSPSWELVSRAKAADLTVVGSSSVDVFAIGPVSVRVARMSTSDTLIVRRQPRVPYRRILAAVDFSEASRAAIEHAIASFPEADITAVFSLPSRFDPILAGAGMFQEEIEASRLTRIEAAKDRMAEFTASRNGEVRTLVVDGPPAETVEEAVRRRNADLVVVANRGASATRMVLLGTVAESLVREAPCDVMVVRDKSAFRRP